LVTPRNGEPLIAATQDFITASYLQSQKNVFYDRSQFVQICSYMDIATIDIELPPPTIIKVLKLFISKNEPPSNILLSTP
jgi:DNA-directed RNA polymerase III subunit RPC1